MLDSWTKYIGRKVRMFRCKAVLTKPQLAKKSGIPLSTISRIENGKYSPTNKCLLKIANSLNVDIDDIYPDNTDVPELLEVCDGLFTLLSDSIIHGMPITKKVADIRNKAMEILSRNGL